MEDDKVAKAVAKKFKRHIHEMWTKSLIASNFIFYFWPSRGDKNILRDKIRLKPCKSSITDENVRSTRNNTK